MYPEQQRYWTALLNLQRTWASDDDAIGIIPPRHRDFSDPEAWPYRRAQAYLLNNLELLRTSFERLESGQPLEYESINHALEGLTLRLHPWPSVSDIKTAARAKSEIGGRLETLQVTSGGEAQNVGTRYIRATIQRSFYYFAQYVDYRLADPAYPGVSRDRWSIQAASDGSGDLLVVPPETERTDATP